MAKSEEKSKFELQRQEKLEQIKKFGVDPYGGRYDDTASAEDIKSTFKEDEDTQQATAAGRIVLLRDIGKLIFSHGIISKILKDILSICLSKIKDH